MRVPIQRLTDGRYIATLDFEATPKGFEDAFESSLFYRRYQQTTAVGEYNSPDVTALAGNMTAQLVRLRSVDERRACFTLIHIGHFENRYLQMELRPFGPMAEAMRNLIDADPNASHYLTFRIEQSEDDDGEMVVNQISAADFTTD